MKMPERQHWLWTWAAMLSAVVAMADRAAAQGVDVDLAGRLITTVEVEFAGKADVPQNYRSAVLRAFATYPGSRYDPMRANLTLTKVKRLNFAADAKYRLGNDGDGGLVITLIVTLTDIAQSLTHKPIGLFADGSLQDFPTLYASDRTALGAKLENKTMVFSNTDAFFGRPDVLTAGNPLANSPAGRGTTAWLETSVQAGAYGIGSISEKVSVFAGISSLFSGSWGDELFTDESRTHVATEDACAGVIGDNPTPSGGSRQMALLFGRKAFQVDSGMILRLASANGGDRAALQSNPRNAADSLLLAHFTYDAHKLELFRLDPDELEETDSRTTIDGINLEAGVTPRVRVGAMYLQIPESRFSYYTATNVYSRKGLRVADLRVSVDAPAGRPGFYSRIELANQTHDDFDMNAWAGYAELGYQFSDWSWLPTPSYRYSLFSGDNQATATFERWDPLFAGGGGDEWVQGFNQYKVVQTSNVVAHRFMARLQPTPQWELVPQFWIFKADDLNNLGGAQALSLLTSRDLGEEINVTARYVANANLIYVFSTAYTAPRQAIRNALNGNYDNWFSISGLVIARF